MKKLIAFAHVFWLTIICLSCDRTSEDTTNNNPNINVETKLYVLDTAKINTISLTGTNEKTIINRKVNTSSYISEISFNQDGSKFVYNDLQATLNPYSPTNQVRIANSDGTNDKSIYTTTIDKLLKVKFCKDGKIFFVKRNISTNAIKNGLMNEDGSGLVETTGYYGSFADITSDRKYLLLNTNMSSVTPSVQILDLSLDGGAGGNYHIESFPGVQNYLIRKGSFTKDNKFAFIPYIEGDIAKVRVIDMTAKTSTTKTITSGASYNPQIFIDVSNDNKTAIVTLTSPNSSVKTKTYIYNLDTNSFTSFSNNDDAVSQVYGF